MPLSEINLKLSENSDRDFQDWLTLKYGVTERDGKALYFICSEYGACRTFTVNGILKDITRN
jgi:hypothetical protein